MAGTLLQGSERAATFLSSIISAANQTLASRRQEYFYDPYASEREAVFPVLASQQPMPIVKPAIIVRSTQWPSPPSIVLDIGEKNQPLQLLPSDVADDSTPSTNRQNRQLLTAAALGGLTETMTTTIRLTNSSSESSFFNQSKGNWSRFAQAGGKVTNATTLVNLLMRSLEADNGYDDLYGLDEFNGSMNGNDTSYIDLEYATHIGMLSLIMFIIIVNIIAVITLSYGIRTPIGPLTIRAMFFMQTTKRYKRRQVATAADEKMERDKGEHLKSPNGDFGFFDFSANPGCDSMLLKSPPSRSNSGRRHHNGSATTNNNNFNSINSSNRRSRSNIALAASAATAAINRRRLAVAGACSSPDDIPNLDCSTFPYLLSLAISDLFIGIIIAPLQFETFRQNGHWGLGPLICDLWRAADIFFCTCSALHTAVIAVDRWWALSKHHSQFRWRRRVNMQRTMLIFPWFLSAMVSFPVMFVWQIEAPDAEEKRRNIEVCEPVMDNVYIMLSAMVSFFLPLATTVSFYVQVACAMRRRLSKLRDVAGGVLDMTADSVAATARQMTTNRAAVDVEARWRQRRMANQRIRELKQHRSLLKSMAIVVLFYCLCWAPLYTTLFIQAVCSCPEAAWDFWLSLFTWIGYANSAINPLIYFCTLYEFRLLSITLVKLLAKYATDMPLIFWNRIRYYRCSNYMYKRPSSTVTKSSLATALTAQKMPQIPALLSKPGSSPILLIKSSSLINEGILMKPTNSPQTIINSPLIVNKKHRQQEQNQAPQNQQDESSATLVIETFETPSNATTTTTSACSPGLLGENIPTTNDNKNNNIKPFFPYYDEWGRPVNSESKEATF